MFMPFPMFITLVGSALAKRVATMLVKGPIAKGGNPAQMFPTAAQVPRVKRGGVLLFALLVFQGFFLASNEALASNEPTLDAATSAESECLAGAGKPCTLTLALTNPVEGDVALAFLTTGG